MLVDHHQALVAPYEWQCFYVPILRGDMVDAMLGAPFAKLLGWVKTKEIVNPVTYFDDCDYTFVLHYTPRVLVR